MKQHFADYADKTLDRARATYAERGAQYSDTWKTCQFNALRATLIALGIKSLDVDLRALRAIAAASLVDIKHERLNGGYKDDHIIDGINYMALLSEEMRQIQGKD